MAVPGRRNGIIDGDDDEEGVLFLEEGALPESDFEDTPPHLRDLAAASMHGDVVALRQALVMDHSHVIVIVKVLGVYIHLLIVLLNVAKWLIEYEQRHHERRIKRQRTFTRYQTRSIDFQHITCESDVIRVNKRLKTIYGKNRVSGSLKGSNADAMEHINPENKAGADIDESNVPLSTSSSVASNSFIPQGEASSKKRKRIVNVAEDIIKMIAKGLQSISEEISKLVSVVGTPGLESMPNELREMGFDSKHCVAISMYFADNPAQLRLWNGMNAAFKQTFVKIVLEKLDNLDGSIDEPVEDGDTALHLTCLYGHLSCVQLLLERGASVEAKDEDGGIPLHDACAGGYLEIVQLLIGNANSPECLKRMLESVDVEGDTPLHHAARGEHKEIVVLLLSIGASPTTTNVYGKTPDELVEANTEVWTILEAATRASAMASRA